jgi:hypothetical protein
MVMAINEGQGGKGKSHGNKGGSQGMGTSRKRAMTTATRVVGDEESTGDRDAIATATMVVGIEEGNDEGSKSNGDGDGNNEGNGNQQRQHGQLLWQRG